MDFYVMSFFSSMLNSNYLLIH